MEDNTMRRKAKKRNGLREIPDDLWALIERIVPPDKPPGSNGCPRVPNRTIMNGILYVLRTGCQWKMVPRVYSSGSTCHRRFQEWVRAGIFEQAWRVCLKHYDDLQGIDWRYQSMDSATVSAPVKGGTTSEKTRQIAVNLAPNGTTSRMLQGFRWPSRSLAPIGTT
jgi:transposase